MVRVFAKFERFGMVINSRSQRIPLPEGAEGSEVHKNGFFEHISKTLEENLGLEITAVKFHGKKKNYK